VGFACLFAGRQLGFVRAAPAFQLACTASFHLAWLRRITPPPKLSLCSCFSRLWRLPLTALKASFPLKGKYLYQIFINCSVFFYKKPEQSATPKDIPPCGGKTFALRVRVALMNIWVIFKNPGKMKKTASLRHKPHLC